MEAKNCVLITSRSLNRYLVLTDEAVKFRPFRNSWISRTLALCIHTSHHRAHLHLSSVSWEAGCFRGRWWMHRGAEGCVNEVRATSSFSFPVVCFSLRLIHHNAHMEVRENLHYADWEYLVADFLGFFFRYVSFLRTLWLGVIASAHR